MLLYYITDRRSFAGDELQQRRALLDRIGQAAAAGVDFIQLREKDLPASELEPLARAAVAAVRDNSSSTRILINTHTEIALACGADGVHLTSGSLAASEIRALWTRVADRAPIIGVSAHNIDDVRYAEAHGADFAVLAPIFEKPGTDLPGLGLECLAEACRGAHPPINTESAPKSQFSVLALGGVRLKNAAGCLRAGAAGLAGIRLFQAGDVRETVCLLRDIQPN